MHKKLHQEANTYRLVYYSAILYVFTYQRLFKHAEDCIKPYKFIFGIGLKNFDNTRNKIINTVHNKFLQLI